MLEREDLDRFEIRKSEGPKGWKLVKHDLYSADLKKKMGSLLRMIYPIKNIVAKLI